MSTNDHDQIDDWLLGRLDADEDDAVEALLRQVEEDELALAEDTLATVWIANATATPARPSLLERLQTSIDPKKSLHGFAGTIAELLQTTSARALELLDSIDPDNWLHGPGPGTWLIHIEDVPLAETAIVGFIRVDVGAEFPHHEHVGDEKCLVLSGELHDDGEVYRRGQIARRSGGSDHTIRPGSDEPLVFLTIVDRGVKFGEFFVGPGDPDI